MRTLRALAVWGAVATMAPVAALAVPVLPDHFADTVVASGLQQPTAMAWLPDGRLIVIEQVTAHVRLIVKGALVPTPIFTVPDVNADFLERGLLGVAVDPGFPARPYVYFFLSHKGTPNTSWTVRYALTGDLADGASANLAVDPASAFPILTDVPDDAVNHNAGTLRFGPDGLLYVSIGDDNSSCSAQDPSSLHGEILRLDVSKLPDTGTGPPAKSALVPAGNPFDGPDDDTRLVIAYGLRNPFRIHVDRVSGRVLIGDVGQASFEELDVLEPDGLGKNFGWPLREGPNAFLGCAGVVDTGQFTEPIAFYGRTGLTSAAIIAAGFYHGVSFPTDLSFPPEYEGDAFFAEYYGGFIRRLHRAADGTWSPASPVAGQPSATNWAEGISTAADFGIGPDGALYYLSQFGNGGSLHRIAFDDAALTLTADDARVEPGATGVAISVRANVPITVGSTDVRLRYDPTRLQATDVTSTLENFTFAIDAAGGTVTTASASAAGQRVGGATALFTVLFNVKTGVTGCSPLTVEDADGTPPDDLTGAAPPIPPPAIPYTAVAGTLCSSVCGNGVVEPGEDCDDGNRVDGDCCSADCRFELPDSPCGDTDCIVDRDCDGHGVCGGGTPRSCDDGNVCTDDACVPGTGCTHTANTAPCEDGNACTGPDVCAGTICVAGPARSCDDGDPCTIDGCTAQGGCTHTPAPDGTACADDGNVCTFDRCVAGACAHPSAVDCSALGDVDCDGRGTTPIDGQVIACLVLGRCTAADVPSPCDDPTVRRMRGDLDLSGTVDGTDASAALDVFVGRQRLADTRLGACCAAALIAGAP